MSPEIVCDEAYARPTSHTALMSVSLRQRKYMSITTIQSIFINSQTNGNDNELHEKEEGEED